MEKHSLSILHDILERIPLDMASYLTTTELLEKTSLLSHIDKEYFRNKLRKLNVKRGFPLSVLDVLAKQQDLQHLDIEKTDTTTILSLCRALQRLGQLRHLSIGWCGVGVGHDPAVGECLSEALVNQSHLEYLKLHGGGIAGRVATFTSVAGVLRHLKQLQHLDLEYNHFGRVCVASLAGTLVHLSQLRNLNIKGNDILDEDAIILSKELHHLKQLRYLNLGNNKFGNAATTSLSGALSCLKQLQHLNMEHNGICNAGAISLAGSFRYLSQLQYLNLGRNNISVDGATSLAGALYCLKQLQYLSLRSNRINDVGVTALVGASQDLVQLRLDVDDQGPGNVYAMQGMQYDD